MLTLGVLSLVMSFVAYVLCILVFAGHSKSWRAGMFACFTAKAITWSPFLGIEMYDTLFEHIYHDVQFQVNVIKPRSLTVSPANNLKRKSSGKLAVIKEQEGEGHKSNSPKTV